MSKLDDLRRDRKAAAEKMDTAALALADAADDAALAAAQGDFDAAKAEFDTLTTKVAALESAEAARAASARPGADQNQPGAPAHVASVPAQSAEKGLKFGRMLRTLAAAGGRVREAQQIAEEQGQSGLFANLNTQTGAAGGYLVPEDTSGEVIELLREQAVITQLPPRFVPLPNGNMTMNRVVTGSSFAYGAEQSDAPATGETFGQMRLSAKKLRGIIPISNDLLRAAGTAVDRIVRDDAVEGAAYGMDEAMLRGLGTDYSPRGLRYQHAGFATEATHVLTMTATPDLQKVTNDLSRLELAMRKAKVNPVGAAWVMAPRTETYLMNLRNANGILAFPEMENGMLRRKKYHVTTAIPDNLGGGGNESEIYLVQPNQLFFGEHMGLEIAISNEAAYKDTTGTMQSAYSRDETLMRVIMMHDIGMRHLQALSILTGVTWSPA